MIGEGDEDRQELEEKVDNLDKEVGNILSSLGSNCGLLCFYARHGAGFAWSISGFAKVTILDN